MTDEKDFKRLVRARMADTGELYTTARAGLRPEAPRSGASLDGVVPMDLAALEAWRAERPQPAPGPAAPPTSYGPDWELTVDAGGRLELLQPPALEVARVAALGSALSGVGYVIFGLHLRLSAPAGSDPDDPRAPSPQAHRASLEPLQRVQAELHHRLREHLGVEPSGVMGFTTGRVRREDGELVLPGRSETKVLLGQRDDGLGGVLDPSTWSMLPGEPLGEPWAAYGVVMHLQHDFPTKRFPTDPPAGFTGPFHVAPVVDEEYWAHVGEVFTAAAASVGLPLWPLQQSSLHDPTARGGQGKRWQQPV